MFKFSNGKLQNMPFADILSSGVVRSRSCRGSENERTACAFMFKVTARNIKSTLYKRKCHRDDLRVVISTFIYLATLFVSSCRHGHMLETFSDGIHLARPEANRMYNYHLTHVIATKKKSTSFDSTRRCVGACMGGGKLAPNETHTGGSISGSIS